MTIEEEIAAEKSRLDAWTKEMRRRITEDYRQKLQTLPPEVAQFLEALLNKAMSDLDKGLTDALTTYGQRLENLRSEHDDVVKRNPAIAENAGKVHAMGVNLVKKAYEMQAGILMHAYEGWLD